MDGQPLHGKYNSPTIQFTEPFKMKMAVIIYLGKPHQDQYCSFRARVPSILNTSVTTGSCLIHPGREGQQWVSILSNGSNKQGLNVGPFVWESALEPSTTYHGAPVIMKYRPKIPEWPLSQFKWTKDDLWLDIQKPLSVSAHRTFRVIWGNRWIVKSITKAKHLGLPYCPDVDICKMG